jgi:hypothetical protein
VTGQNGNVQPILQVERELLERMLREAAEQAQRPQWGNADDLAEHWGNVYQGKTIRNRSAPSVPEADRIPSHPATPGGSACTTSRSATSGCWRGGARDRR